MTRKKRGKEFYGDILAIRAIEDCIRATKKYTEGIQTIRKAHPIQGSEFPSQVLYKDYEVYPDMEVGLDMSVGDFFDWVWGDTPCLVVMFHYDYREKKASVLVREGNGAVKKLAESIPGFSDALKDVNGFRKNSKA